MALLLSDTSNRWGEIEERADTPLQSISTHYLGSLVRSALSPKTKTITEKRVERYSYTQTQGSKQKDWYTLKNRTAVEEKRREGIPVINHL